MFIRIILQISESSVLVSCLSLTCCPEFFQFHATVFIVRTPNLNDFTAATDTL